MRHELLRRRTETPLTPEKLFDELRYSPLHWPGKTVCLERNSLRDYAQRPGSAQASIAELYHENSKLFPQMLPELTASLLEPAALRREFVRRRGAAANAARVPDLDLGPWSRLLTTVATTTDRELFYAIELRILARGMLAVHEPVSDTLQVVKRISDGHVDMLRKALRLMSAAEEPPHDGPVLFLLGNFARNELLFGARGYRRTLLEAGRVTERVLRQAAQLGLAARVCCEFTDRDVDAILDSDGTEEGTLVVFELGGATDVR